jgi:hypothetical protein
MRLGVLVPALVLGGALVAPSVAEADGNRRVDGGRHYGYERSDRGDRRHRSPPTRLPTVLGPAAAAPSVLLRAAGTPVRLPGARLRPATVP